MQLQLSSAFSCWNIIIYVGYPVALASVRYFTKYKLAETPIHKDIIVIAAYIDILHTAKMYKFITK